MNTRLVVLWSLVGALAFVAAVAGITALWPPAHADSTGLQVVRVQEYITPPSGPFSKCLVFTHDTAQGAAIAVVCK